MTKDADEKRNLRMIQNFLPSLMDDLFAILIINILPQEFATSAIKLLISLELSVVIRSRGSSTAYPLSGEVGLQSSENKRVLIRG